MKTLSRHSELAKAFTYTLNQWPALTYYAENGWAEADNNIAENALRMVSLGRKNWLFFGSDHGEGALLYSDRDVQTERRGSRKLPSPCPDVIATGRSTGSANCYPGASHCQLNNTSPSIRFSLYAYDRSMHPPEQPRSVWKPKSRWPPDPFCFKCQLTSSFATPGPDIPQECILVPWFRSRRC
jgi:hypothetical protein